MKRKIMPLILLPLCLAIVAISIAVVNASKQQKEMLSGIAETAHIDVASKIPGRIDTLLVQEGTFVSKGSILARLESKELVAKVEQARGAMEAAKAKMELSKNGVRPQELEAANNLYMQAKAQFDLMEKTWTRIRNLYRDSVISLQERDVAETQFISAREQKDAAKSRYEMAKEGARSEDKVAAQSIYYQAQSVYQEACAYFDELTIKSPINGEIEKVISDPGEVISAGYPIITVTNTSDIWVIVQVKENAMIQFKKGSIFTGAIPALGNKASEFKVSFISPMADFATWRPTNQKGEFDIRTFEIHLRPTSIIDGLRAGMTVNFTL